MTGLWADSQLRTLPTEPGRATRPPGLRGWCPTPLSSSAGPRYDTRTIVWICLTLITGLVVLLLLLICKKRCVVPAPNHPKPLLWSPVSPACAEPHQASVPLVPAGRFLI